MLPNGTKNAIVVEVESTGNGDREVKAREEDVETKEYEVAEDQWQKINWQNIGMQASSLANLTYLILHVSMIHNRGKKVTNSQPNLIHLSIHYALPLIHSQAPQLSWICPTLNETNVSSPHVLF